MCTTVEKSIPLGYDTVTGQVVPDISKDCSSFIYRVQRPKKVGTMEHHIPEGGYHGVLSYPRRWV